MLQLVLYGLLAIIVAGGLFLVAARFLPAGEQIAPALRDEPSWLLPPDRQLQAEDIDTVRLPVALRGYRFAETDILLDRLAGELRNRDLEIARLRDHAAPAPVPAPAPIDLEKPADGVEPAHGAEPADGDEPVHGAEPADGDEPAHGDEPVGDGRA